MCRAFFAVVLLLSIPAYAATPKDTPTRTKNVDLPETLGEILTVEFTESKRAKTSRKKSMRDPKKKTKVKPNK